MFRLAVYKLPESTNWNVHFSNERRQATAVVAALMSQPFD